MTDNQILRLFGIFYLCVAINILLNPDYYKRFVGSFSNERLRSIRLYGIMFFGGLIFLTLSLL